MQKPKTSQETQDVRHDRKFSVSANRGGASHKVRYVEAGGAAVDTEECTFCQAVPDLSGNHENHEGDESPAKNRTP
ncbi:hypothetical protein [Marinobacter orientalis]|uniref:Uncharacterized protein n=1 Tax=Marinobacter orientalis TaxID=1928859 RepID=A0A7Y0WSC4_9GAMM|nr:hypothetical protein [Marinobacter orientalis]NMT63687.1 hypothetical protein [Marinobacter orientalis]TGX49802.1 hypothetical protein DIT72_08770 [Marinobacter orientalis]